MFEEGSEGIEHHGDQVRRATAGSGTEKTSMTAYSICSRRIPPFWFYRFSSGLPSPEPFALFQPRFPVSQIKFSGSPTGAGSDGFAKGLGGVQRAARTVVESIGAGCVV